jgi:hypothetical protein
MATPSRIALFTFVLSLPLLARPRTDVIVMTNGDRLTCEIRGLQGGLLSVKLEYVDGTISVDWARVARVESSQPFVVETENGTTYTGSLRTVESPGDKPRTLEIVNEDPGRDAVLDQSQVVVANQYGDSFWQRLQGNLSTGIIFSKANSSTQYNLASDLTLQKERSTFQLNYSSTLSTSSGAKAATRNQFDFQPNRLLGSHNWFYAGTVDFLQSSSQGINSQTTYGGGLGRYLKKTNTARVTVLCALAVMDTQYNDRPTQNNLVSVIGANIDLFQFKKTELSLAPTLFPSLSDQGRVRFNMNASYKIQIVSGFWWNITFYGNWDNRPPPGLVGDDYGTSVGITYRLH